MIVVLDIVDLDMIVINILRDIVDHVLHELLLDVLLIQALTEFTVSLNDKGRRVRPVAFRRHPDGTMLSDLLVFQAHTHRCAHAVGHLEQGFTTHMECVGFTVAVHLVCNCSLQMKEVIPEDGLQARLVGLFSHINLLGYPNETTHGSRRIFRSHARG